ncbi:MAG TPA: ADP-ribosylglycohydrolase family protein [Methanosarcina sp.]|nr:ADP-ribosylglycohydrolase family protein [Methanosarcina sp.]
MSNNIPTLSSYRGCLLGLAIGDALGTAVEFMPRGSFQPVTDMRGGGFFNLPAGYWTDDTSMTLCLAESIIQTGKFDPIDQMNRYCDWYENGYLSSIGRCFDIGETTRLALERYLKNGLPYAGSIHPNSSGNGGIMRLAPVVMGFHDQPIDVIDDYVVKSSMTTHGSPACIKTAGEMGRLLVELLNPYPIVFGKQEVIDKTIDQIKGSGFVVESYEAALWCFLKTNSFEEAVLTAVNLGDDADTTGAIVGQLAGAFYGVEGIPEHWPDKLHMRDMIDDKAIKLYEMAYGSRTELQ